jgi:parvulin-like peptidyl-prolyl isomerase
MKRAASGKPGEEIIDSWIDIKVVDHEALSRDYETNTDLRKMVRRYENQLLKNTYIMRMIGPSIKVSDEELEEYYLKHQESYLRPVRYKIQQITVPTMDEARIIWDDLSGGTDFSWLAKRKSTDAEGPEGGDIGWLTKSELPDTLRDVVDDLEPGGISPVVKVDFGYRIIRLLEKTEAEAKDFEKVKGSVYRAYVRDRIETAVSEHASRLKEDAEVKVYKEAVRKLEEKLGK